MKALFLTITLLLLTVATYAQTATNFSVTASTVGSTAIQLQGTVPGGNTISWATQGPGCGGCLAPQHGAITPSQTATGVIVYTPASGYVGADSFTYVVYANPTGGGSSTVSSAATVTITVTNAKTRIIQALTNPDGTARAGKVTLILTQPVTGPDGLIAATASVSGTLDSQGRFDVSVYPSASLSPQAYYQLWYADSGSLRRELIGIYEIPASTATITNLTPYKVIDTNLAARYTFASIAVVNAIIATGAGSGVPQSRTISAGTGLTGGGDLSVDRTIGLGNTAVTPGAYTLANLTVDAQGRITAASNGSAVTGAGDTDSTFPYWTNPQGSLANSNIYYSRAFGNPSIIRPLVNGDSQLGSDTLRFATLYLSSFLYPGTVTFAQLGTPTIPAIVFCSNCDAATGTTCTSVATQSGAMAMRVNGVWKCY